jgi:ribonuclease BN (tRNA processing enzyme)
MARLIILGCGTPTPSTVRWGTSFLLQAGGEWLLVDCGPAATYKLYRAGVKVTEVDHLFFTHLHSDHISDYPCFLLTRFDMLTGQENPLEVYGPPPTERMTELLMGGEGSVFWHDVVARTNHPMSLAAYRRRRGTGERRPPVVHAHDIGPGKIASGPGWEVTAVEVEHAQPYLECLAFRFDTDDGAIVFGGDTRPCEALVGLAQGADLLVTECVGLEGTLSEGARLAESDTRGCGQVAADAGVKRLVVNHQPPWLDEPASRTRAIAQIAGVYGGPLIWGEELLEIEIG